MTALREGMRIAENAAIVTASGSSVQLQADGLPEITIGASESVTLTRDVFKTAEPSEAAVTAPSSQATDALIEAINRGQDPFTELDPAAAVLTGGEGGGGSTFVRLASILEATVPLALAYPGLENSVEELPRWDGLGYREPQGPSIFVPDENDKPGPSGMTSVPGNISIAEDATSPVSSSFTISTPGGLQSLWVGGIQISENALQNTGTQPIVITTSKGTLTITGYDPVTGKVTYDYLANGPQDHSNGDESVLDDISLRVVDKLGKESSGQLSVLITDTEPVAQPDTNEITENTASVGGNVILGTGAGAAGKDTLGADAATVTGVQADTATGHVANGGVGVAVQGKYGTITLQADGSYV
ncbi:retention module-containing protein, partial [Comamonas composti]|uniref:retention module-containing protein n=1 Tax=Comamonas composti TaxID=408558 RepID=UPI001FE0F912